jgi:hypothetical protein
MAEHLGHGKRGAADYDCGMKRVAWNVPLLR